MKLRAEHLLLAILLGFVGVSFTACASNEEAGLTAKSGLLRGMVYNENRMPVLDATVSYVQNGKTVQSSLTDLHGRYALPDVAFGPVTLQFTKEGYEPLVWSFAFRGQAQVVYAQIVDLDELLDDAADNIQKRDWVSATSYLDRIHKLQPRNAVAAYLQAEMLARQGKLDQAVAVLEKLSSENDTSFAVELTLADLYQNKLDDPDKALIHLKKALTVRDDVDVENRVAALEKK